MLSLPCIDIDSIDESVTYKDRISNTHYNTYILENGDSATSVAATQVIGTKKVDQSLTQQQPVHYRSVRESSGTHQIKERSSTQQKLKEAKEEQKVCNLSKHSRIPSVDSSNSFSQSSCNQTYMAQPATPLHDIFSGVTSDPENASSSSSSNFAAPSLDEKDTEEKIPVFDHILLMPPSCHKPTHKDCLPSNYLTPEEEAVEALRLWNIQQTRAKEEYKRRKRRRLEGATSISDDEEEEEEFEIGRSGRKRKKPKRFSFYVMDKSKEQENESDDDEFDEYSHSSESSEGDHNVFSDNDTVSSIEEKAEINPSLPANVSTNTISDRSNRNRSKYSRDEHWDRQVDALKKFKALHGHTRVKQRNAEDPALARWLKKVREKYKKVQKGQEIPSLSSKRIAELDEIGFTWSVRSKDFSQSFEEHLANLNEFKRKHGHTRVPHVYEKNPRLGRWCHHMKLSYNKMIKGEKPMIKIQQDQIDKLDKIGFQWKIRHVVASNKEANQYDFEQGFMKLKAFQTKHGHCNVPLNFSNQTLIYWIATVKSSYRQMKEGKKPIMRLSGYQISLLDELKFDWTDDFDTSNYQTSTYLPWNIRYKQLCEYKARYGNSRVPSRYDDDRAFGSWVRSQRKALGNAVVGNKSPLTDEQRQKLENLGLEWTVYQYETENGKVPRMNTEVTMIKAKSESEIKHTKQRKRKLPMDDRLQASKRRKENFDQWLKKLHLDFESEKRKEKALSTKLWLQKLRLDFLFEETTMKEVDVNLRRQQKPFEIYVAELKLFKAHHGHCNVTGKMNKSLSAWISNVRTSYKRIQDGRPPLIKLTDDRMKSLKAIDFEFKKSPRSKQREIKDSGFNITRTITAANDKNHMYPYSADGTKDDIGSNFYVVDFEVWCKNLRLGFIWNTKSNGAHIHDSSSRISMQKIFESNLEELKTFKEIHGHLNVSTKDNKALNNWISRIRSSYRKILSGEAPGIKLTAERLESLIEIDFDFGHKKRGRPSQIIERAKKSPFRPANQVHKVYDISSWCKNLGLGFIWNSNGSKLKASYQNQEEFGKDYSVAEKAFDAKLQELKTFKIINGHMNVHPKENKSLYCWVCNIRLSQKRINQGKKPLIKLTHARLQKLVEIDFTFESHSTYKDSNVPGMHHPQHSLKQSPRNMNGWCKTLNLGFDWISKEDSNVPNSWAQKNFESNLNELKSFFDVHGHMDVSPNENKSLNCWVQNLKTSHNRIQEGKSPLIKLTDDRIESLKAIGFTFKSRSRLSTKKTMNKSSSNDLEFWCSCLGLGFEWNSNIKQSQFERSRKTFDKHLEELKLYKLSHGDLNLAKMTKENKPLSNWCKNIRSSYARLANGKSPKGLNLTADKIEKLKSVGFEFPVKKTLNEDEQNEAKKSVQSNGDKSKMVVFWI